MSRGSNFSRQHQSDEDFTRAAWDCGRDAELTTRSLVECRFTLSQQRGVWIARSTLVTSPEASERRVMAKTESSYPNSRALTLGAFLFQQMNSVMLMGESAYADTVRKALRRE